jgi:AraC-like DNA-binding protein
MNDKLVIIISGSAVINLTLITILSWIKYKNRPSNFWLGCMFLASSIAILDNTHIFAGKGTIILYHLALITNLSWGAYLIEFTKCLRHPCNKQLHFNWKLFIPSYLYVPFFILTLVEPHWSYDTLNLARSGQLTLFGIFYNFIICIYTIATNIILLRQEYAINKKCNPTPRHTRIKELLWVMLTLQTMAFIPFMLKIDVRYLLLYMPIFGQIFFVYIFFRMTFSTQLLFSNELISDKSNETTTKYATLKLNDERTEEIRAQILELMSTQKPYLNMDYTLTEMARDLKILPNLLSMVINSKLNCSFPEYVNSLRIKTAVELLNKASKNNLTIEAIAYESGFNNRTSFYKAFKKETGKLPSEYLKKVVEKKEVV